MGAVWRVTAVAAVLVLAGCASAPTAAPPLARCAKTPVTLLDPTPLFTGPGPTAALDRPLSKGQPLLLCGVQGQRQQVLLPRPGRPCSGPADCSGGWIPAHTRTGPAR
jgi:hypothetical protein